MNEFDNREPQLADLKAILALLQDGTVTRASQRLGVTQSALARALADPASRVLRIVEDEIAALSTFDPSTTTREFRIGVNEIGAITMVPRLLKRLTAAAPHARLSPLHVTRESMAAALEAG